MQHNLGAISQSTDQSINISLSTRQFGDNKSQYRTWSICGCSIAYKCWIIVNNGFIKVFKYYNNNNERRLEGFNVRINTGVYHVEWFINPTRAH